MGIFSFLSKVFGRNSEQENTKEFAMQIKSQNRLYATNAKHIASKKYDIEYSIDRQYELNLDEWVAYTKQHSPDGMLGIYTSNNSSKFLTVQCYPNQTIEDYEQSIRDTVAGFSLAAEKKENGKLIKIYYDSIGLYYFVYFNKTIFMIIAKRVLVPYDGSDAMRYFEDINASNERCANAIINSLQKPQFVQLEDKDVVVLNNICLTLSRSFLNEPDLINFQYSLTAGTTKTIVQNLYNFLNSIPTGFKPLSELKSIVNIGTTTLLKYLD